VKDRPVVGYAPPELARLRERTELQFRQAALAEHRLRSLAERAGLRPDIVVLDEPLAPRRPAAREPDRADPAPAAGPSPDPCPDMEGPAPRPLDPAPGWACSTLRGSAGARRVIGVSVCGFDAEGVRRVVELVASQQQRDRDFIPVFLTDCNEFEVFGEYGFAFEYLPPPGRRAGHPREGDWPAYAARRRRLIERKWGLSEVIAFGMGEFGR
jgi:hypothetical protein